MSFLSLIDDFCDNKKYDKLKTTLRKIMEL